MKKIWLSILFLIFSAGYFSSQTLLFLDDFGTVAQNPLVRAGYITTAPAGSPWELRTTGASSVYSWAGPVVSASGGANAFTNLGTDNNPKSLTYDNSLSTSGYSGISVRFGGLKSAAAVPVVTVYYSTDGVVYTSAGNVTLTTSWAAYTVNLPAAADNQANLRVRFGITASTNSALFIRIDDFHVIGGSCSAVSEPTTQASASAASSVGCNSALLSWTNGNGNSRLVVLQSGSVPSTPTDGLAYTGNATFGSGSALGSGFVLSSGTANSVFIFGLNASTTYYWSVFEYNGSAACTDYKPVGSSGNFTTTSCSVPLGITAIYIDACPGSCVFEGNNEMMWGQTGSYGLKVATNGPVVQYNATSPPTTTYISTYAQYASNVTALNTAVTSCGSTTFIDPNPQGYIPANSKFLIAHSCMCNPLAYDLSGLCSGGPIYVAFGNDAAWPCGSAGGIFGNYSACTLPNTVRYIEFDFNNWGVNQVPIYNYDVCFLTSHVDGDYVLFNPTGGAAIYYGNSGCVVPLIVLPLELIEFTASQNANGISVNWKTANEKNIEKVTLQKSYDAVSFFDLDDYFSSLSDAEHNYYYNDADQSNQTIYYRLKISENTGQVNYSSEIIIDQQKKNNCQLWFSENNLFINSTATAKNKIILKITDLAGRCVYQKQLVSDSEKINLSEPGINAGLYIVSLESGQSILKTSKIIIP